MNDFRSKTNLLDRRCLDEPVAPRCKQHIWEQDDFGRRLVCVQCKEVRVTASYAPLHHRSCFLRRGGDTCTC